MGGKPSGALGREGFFFRPWAGGLDKKVDFLGGKGFTGSRVRGSRPVQVQIDSIDDGIGGGKGNLRGSKEFTPCVMEIINGRRPALDRRSFGKIQKKVGNRHD